MSFTTETNDATSPEGVVERLDGARSRMRDAANKAKERLAPTLERASETAETAKRQVTAVGNQAVTRVKRHPWATGLALAGIGIGAFFLIRSPARERVLNAAQELLGRSGARERLRDLASRVDVDRLRDLASSVDVDRLRSRIDLSGLADDFSALADKLRDQLRSRLAA